MSTSPANRPDTPAGLAPHLDVRGLRVAFKSPDGDIEVVRGVSFSCGSDEVLAIVGESGSGKSVTVLSLMRLLPARSAAVTGSVRLEGTEILGLPDGAMRAIRGSRIGMIFQNPKASLNPAMTVGTQMAEVIRRASPAAGAALVRARAVDLLARLSLRDPAMLLARYPHQLSGGMAQRVAIAMALAARPGLLLADEPTTALDALVQASILSLLAAIHAEERLPLVIVTHDFGVVRAMASRVLVMYAGRAVEEGRVDDVLDRPAHPYTRALIAAIPAEDQPAGTLQPIEGVPPNLAARLPGCPFAPRCREAMAICRHVEPASVATPAGGLVACHLHAGPVRPT